MTAAERGMSFPVTWMAFFAWRTIRWVCSRRQSVQAGSLAEGVPDAPVSLR
jgi:hypothetical protein